MNDDAIASTGEEEARRPRREADLKLSERLHAADVAKTLRYPTGLGYLKLRQDYPEEATALDARSRAEAEAKRRSPW